MATRVQISCINNKTNRTNPHERISHVGGVHNGQRWKMEQPKAVAAVLDGTYEFFVSQGGYTVDVIVAYHNGNPYLKTRADGVQPDNLLALPECP